MEYCRRFCSKLPHVFQNYSDEIPFISLRKEPEFLWNFSSILMEFLWYFLKCGCFFDAILGGILMEFQSKKQCKRSYLRCLTDFLRNCSSIFSSCYTPKEHGKSLALTELNWCFDGNFTPLPLLIETFTKKAKLHKQKHYIIIIFSCHRLPIM